MGVRGLALQHARLEVRALPSTPRPYPTDFPAIPRGEVDAKEGALGWGPEGRSCPGPSTHSPRPWPTHDTSVLLFKIVPTVPAACRAVRLRCPAQVILSVEPQCCENKVLLSGVPVQGEQWLSSCWGLQGQLCVHACVYLDAGQLECLPHLPLHHPGPAGW